MCANAQNRLVETTGACIIIVKGIRDQSLYNIDHAQIQEFSSRSIRHYKKSTAVLFFSSSAYFTEVKWLISKKTIISLVPEAVQHFPGGWGPSLSRRGSNQLLISYIYPYNWWFSRGVRAPCPPPLWIRPGRSTCHGPQNLKKTYERPLW